MNARLIELHARSQFLLLHGVTLDLALLAALKNHPFGDPLRLRGVIADGKNFADHKGQVDRFVHRGHILTRHEP